MPDKKARHNLGETCPSCHAVHLTPKGNSACVGHSRSDPTRACRQEPKLGLDVCYTHGGASRKAQAAGERRDTERKARAVLEKLGAAGTPVTDPIATLCAIAGRAVEFMEQLGARVAEFELGDSDVQIRLYKDAIKDAAQVVESIIRMGIAERFAKQNAEAVAAYVACLDAIVTDLGHNPRDPQVAGVIAKRLELVS